MPVLFEFRVDYRLYGQLHYFRVAGDTANITSHKPTFWD
jgi:hypothetical protein